MTTTRARARARARGEGAGEPPGLRLGPPERARKPQLPQMATALLLMGLCALLAVVFYSRATASGPAVVLAVDMARGERLAPELLRVVQVSADEALPLTPPAEAAGLYGRRAVADLAAGTPLSPALLVSGAPLAAGESVVGLALAPGEYPSPLLTPGDYVSVVRAGRDEAPYSAPAPAAEIPGERPPTPALVLVAAAEVFDIEPLGAQGSLFISLRVAAGDAPIVAAADAADSVRLVQVPAPGDGAR